MYTGNEAIRRMNELTKIGNGRKQDTAERKADENDPESEYAACFEFFIERIWGGEVSR